MIEIQNSLSREHTFELLCNFAYSEQSSLDLEQISKLLKKQTDWSFFFRLSESHRIRPLVYNAILQYGTDEIPQRVLDKLQKLSEAEEIHNLFLTKELGRLLDLFESRRIHALTLKGPVLADIAYGDLNLRSYIDMDILINRPEYNRVRAVLMKEGYLPHPKVRSLNRMQEKLYVLQHAQYPFTKGDYTYRLDLHTRVMPQLLQYNMHFDALWDRACEVEVAATPFRTFEAEDMLLVLCFHGVKNRWDMLKYVCDVSELIRATPDLNWEKVLQRTYRMKSIRTLVLGLMLSKVLLRTPLPPEIQQLVEQSRDLDGIVTLLLDKLSRKAPGNVMSLSERFHFYMTIQDTFSAKMKYVTHAVLRRLDSVLVNTEVA